MTIADATAPIARPALKAPRGIQLDSRLHLLDRRTLRDIQYEKTSLMPRDYKTRLSAQEFQDLMAFLTRLSRRESRK